MTTTTQPAIVPTTITSAFSQPSDDESNLTTWQKNVDGAEAAFTAGKAALYRQDGTPKYAPAEHRERMAALLEPFKQAVANARQAAEEVRGRCEQEATLQGTDPLLRLELPNEQQEVSYKSAIISDDVSKSALPALAQRLEATAIHGSKVEKLLYARYGRARVDEEKRQLMASGIRPTMDRPRAITGAAPEGLGAATKAVEALEQAAADPKLQARLKKMEERRKGAWDLQLHAGKRLAEHDGTAERGRQHIKSYR